MKQPMGWTLKSLEDLATFSQGIQIDVDKQFNTDNEGYVRFLRISDFVNKEEIPRYIENPGNKFLVSNDDLSMIRYGSAGAGDLVRGLTGAIANNLFRVIPNEKEVSKDFLWVYLRQEKIKHFLFGNSTSSTMPAVSFKLVGKVPVQLPPLTEQKKIAQILSTWDQAIATTERLLDLARQQKKALMQQLLTGKRRFPGFDGEWKTYELSNLFDFKKGKGLSKDALCEDGSKCVLYGELYTKYGEVISSVVSRTQANDGLPSKTGDILIPSSTTTSGIDLANATAILEDDVLLGGDINVLRPKKKMNAEFMAHLLTHIKKYDIASRAQGITIIHLYGSDLKTISVRLPDEIEEQNLIASVLLNSQNEIDNLISQLDGLKQEKKALMQALLTGKRRVQVAEAEAA
ncbi:restriction endonuclease subunit S [Undibacterium sp. WLX3042]|uniref:restriction endonuclease subunit S n=1 Tax=Undibacterium sp. WLX3042 TaxID=3412686 RepID=UPI003C2DF875